MLKRITEIIKNKKNWTSILILIASIFASLGSFVIDDSDYSPKIISAILTLIALEFFVLTVGVFEEMQKDLKSLINIKEDILWHDNHVEEVRKILRSAKKNFTVIGGTLSDLSLEKSYIIDASERVIFRLLALDVEKEAVLQQYNKLIERNAGVEDLRHLDCYKGIGNIKIRKFESLPVAYYIASDIDTPNGVIIAIHLLSAGSNRDYPCVKVTPDNEEWYNIYRKQIKTLWGNADPKKKAV